MSVINITKTNVHCQSVVYELDEQNAVTPKRSGMEMEVKPVVDILLSPIGEKQTKRQRRNKKTRSKRFFLIDQIHSVRVLYKFQLQEMLAAFDINQLSDVS